jgi:hypothetical protein
MKSKLDKKSKLSGKAKDSSADKAKPKSSKSPAAPAKAAKPAASSAKNAKAEQLSKAAKPSVPAEAKRSSESKAPRSPEKMDKDSKSQSKNKKPVPAAKSAPVGKAGSKAANGAGSEELSLEEFSISIIKPGETKERIWRTKNFQQFPAQREFGFPDVAPELPSQYSEPKLVLMPKDPEYMFCYWELTPTLIVEKEKEKLPNGNYRETLKINWESKSLFEPNFTFIPVFFWARKWYFGVPQVGQRYQVELGWLSDSGHFISIIRSNLSELPESWAATQKRLAEEGEILAYSSKHTKTLGSSENLVVEDVRAFIPEWNLSSESMSSSSWSRGPSQASTQESGPAKAAPARSKPESAAKRAATPKARLEVSGKVLPGTQVFVGGNAVSTDSQGNFRTDFPYNQDILNLELIARSGASRALTYDLKELVLT